MALGGLPDKDQLQNNEDVELMGFEPTTF